MSPNTTPPATTSTPSTSPRAPYVPPTLESLGSWSAISMQSIPGGGFIQNPVISTILRGVR